MAVTNFPNGISTGGSALKMGTVEVTGATADVETGLSSITGAVVSLGEDPGAGSGDVFQVSYAASGGTLTVKIWQDDATAATEDTTVSYVVWGAE